MLATVALNTRTRSTLLITGESDSYGEKKDPSIEVVLSSEIDDVTENFHKLISLLQEMRNPSAPSVPEHQLRLAFDAVFDRYVVQLCSDGESLFYQEIYENLVSWVQGGYRIKSFDISAPPSFGAAPCEGAAQLIVYEMILADKSSDFLIWSTALVKGGKIVRIQRQSLKERSRVAGQIEPKTKHSKRCFLSTSVCLPTEIDLSLKIHALPSEVRNMLLAQGTQMLPVPDKRDVLKITFRRSRKSGFTQNGILRIEDGAGNPYAGGVYIKEYKKVSHFIKESPLFALHDEKLGQPVAVVLHNRRRDSYTICGGQRLYAVDAPKTKDSGLSFYPWFRLENRSCRDDANNPDRVPSLRVWNGVDYRPLWDVFPCEQSDCTISSTTNEILFCTSSLLPVDEEGQTCSTESSSSEHSTESMVTTMSSLSPSPSPSSIWASSSLGYMRRISAQSGWRITMAPGVDPALVICLAAALDAKMSH